MKSLSITVLSKKPAGGRCTLYAKYAQLLESSLGFTVHTLYPGENQQPAAPGLLIDDKIILPNDGVIIDADDIYKALEQAGFDADSLSQVSVELELLIEEVMSAV